MIEAGFVYVLYSPSCPALKIGGTAVGPSQRLKAINAGAPYGAHGPWHIVDFVQVHDWRHVEGLLHTRFREDRYAKIESASELFVIAADAAQRALNGVDASLVVSRDKLDALFQTHELSSFLQTLFRTTGLANWLHAQGSWTLSLFPTTEGGRYFTINIGGHEVAYASGRPGSSGSVSIIMDSLIGDFAKTLDWVQQHSGSVSPSWYKTALPRAVTVTFSADLAEAQRFFGLSGVRRAISAYWSEALIDLTGRGAESVFKRHHNYNAVAVICRQIASRDAVDKLRRQ